MNWRAIIASLFVLWLVESVKPPFVIAQPIEGKDSSTAADRKTNLEAFLKDAQAYEITVQDRISNRLELLDKPVMNWGGSAFDQASALLERSARGINSPR